MRDKDTLFNLGAGPVAAILLGAALIPLRGLTPVSNLSFAFVALTIVIAEYSGRLAATVTAMVSALSLDFFLTQPYLTLAIEDKHDVIAFAGLAVCGLIAAALGSQREERLVTVRLVQRQRDLLRSLLREWDGSAPLAPQLAGMLQQVGKQFPLASAVIRDDQGDVLASSDPVHGPRPVPEIQLHPEMLQPVDDPGSKVRQWSPAFPGEGGRIALVSGDRLLGWLDVWGNGAPAGAESRRALSDMSKLMSVLIAGNPATSVPGDAESRLVNVR